MVDSGYTGHMTRGKDVFTSFQSSHDQSGNIVFGDKGNGEVLGLGKIAISNDNSISNVLLVNSLRYNLLSISQLCEIGYNCLFTDKGVEVYRREDSSIAFMGHLKGKLYVVDFTSNRVNPETCLMTKSSMGWL